MTKFWRLWKQWRRNNDIKKTKHLNRLAKNQTVEMLFYWNDAFLSKMHYYLNRNIGTRIGTSVDKIRPVENERMAVSLLVFLEMMGSVVSIAVAPAGAIASIKPTRVAMMGIIAIANTSRMTFVKNAKTESSDEYGAMIIEDNVYQPSPDPMAPDSLSGYPSK